MEQVLIRAEIIGENAAGQKHIRLLANNADGIHFWTDDKSIVRSIEPQRKNGMWIEHDPHKWGLGIVFECSECGEKIDCEPSNFCPNCGADMRTPVEIARNIVHKVIDNSVWSDTVGTAEMHKVVDDKYAEMREDGDADVDANT